MSMQDRIAELEATNAELRKQNEILATTRRLEEEARERAEAERDAAIRLVAMARQTFDADGNGNVTRFLSEIREDVLKDMKRLAERSMP